jgi:hypothetical protein
VKTPRGFMFSGPNEERVKKMRELAQFLTKIADFYEKYGEKDEAEK